MQLLNLSLTCIHLIQCGCNYGSNGQSGQGIYSDVICMMASGRIDMRHMVTDRVHLEDIKRHCSASESFQARSSLAHITTVYNKHFIISRVITFSVDLFKYRR